MNYQSTFLTLLSYLFTITSVAQGIYVTSPTNIQPSGKLVVPQYELLELAIDLSDIVISEEVLDYLNYQGSDYTNYPGLNPYNPEDVSFEFQFLEDGVDYTIYGFFTRDYHYKDVQGNIVTSNSTNVSDWEITNNSEKFIVRFAPQKCGTLFPVITLRYRNQNSNSIESVLLNLPFDEIEVIKNGKVSEAVINWNQSRGAFISKDRSSNSTVEFIPLGINAIWTSHYFPNVDKGRSDHLLQNHSLMSEYIDAGASLFRIPMSNWSYNFEYERLNNYSDRLNVAQELDKLFRIAEQNNVKIQLDIEHGTITDAGGCEQGWLKKPSGEHYSQWDYSPYNTYGVSGSDIHQGVLGNFKLGPCATRDDFWTNSLAQEMLRRKLRYIVSRWGYSKSLAFYEILNEYDLLYDNPSNPLNQYFNDAAFRNKVNSWIKEMSLFIKQIDKYYGREIGVSTGLVDYSNQPNYNLFLSQNRGGLTMVNLHDYGVTMNSLFDRYRRSYLSSKVHGMPVLINESGNESWQENGPLCHVNTLDACSSQQARKSLYYTLFSGSLSGNVAWFWKEMRDSGHHTAVYTGVSALFDEIGSVEQFTSTCLNGASFLNPSSYSVSSSTLNVDEFDVLALVNSDQNFGYCYVNNKTAYWQNSICWNDLNNQLGSCDNSINQHSLGHLPYNNVQTGDFIISGLKPNRDYYVEYFNPRTGLLISTGNNAPRFVKSNQIGTLRIAFEDLTYDYIDGGDIFIRFEVCGTKFPSHCGYDERFLDYYSQSLLNPFSFDNGSNALFFANSNNELFSVAEVNGEYDANLIGTIPINPSSQLLEGDQNIFYVDVNGTLKNISKQGGNSYSVTTYGYVRHNTSLTRSTIESKVFYVNSSDKVSNSIFANGQWQSYVLNSNAPTVHNNSSLYWSSAGKVYYCDLIGDIHEYYWQNNTWKFRKTSTLLPPVDNGRFAFTSGKLAYFSSGELIEAVWTGSTWLVNSISVYLPADTNSDIIYSDGVIYYFSDGKLVKHIGTQSDYLDFCGVRAANSGSLISFFNQDFFFANTDGQLSLYEYIGPCKAEVPYPGEPRLDRTQNLLIYPNPSNGVFSINSSDFESVSVFNEFGLEIPIHNSDNTYEFAKPLSGIYFVIIKFKSGELVTEKIVIIK